MEYEIYDVLYILKIPTIVFQLLGSYLYYILLCLNIIIRDI